MAGNTIMTAKSTFGDGLLMDFAPDNTQATCLTHALNATLLTMNGNELSLQNDMGNGRVETAYLPEGYIPVGTCEFGDIIYIVSYNPITNKSQIGCFPSPERNISSEELDGTGCSFQANEFVNKEGEVITTSVKKIIYSNNLNPGDKFIVYTNPIETTNQQYITDFGNTSHILGKFPKNIKFNVVAIEDSGKINYLNSDLKWYDDYYIHTKGNNAEGKPDIDSYRNLLNSGYSVFQSKISGKLAILAELETIKSFDTQYLIFQEDKEIPGTTDEWSRNYYIYLSCNWTSDSPDIYPEGVKLFKGTWNGKGKQYNNIIIESPQIEYPEETTFKNQELSRTNYKEFVNNNYIAQKRIFESKYKEYKDANYIPRKIDVVMENNLPKLGHYIVNKFITQDDKYGFYAQDGSLIEIKNNENYENVELSDSFVHNYFNKDVLIKYATISIPIRKGNIMSDLTGLTYTFSIAPKMSYGYLPNLKKSHTIDFGKIGSGIINLTEWRYYNNDNISTIKIGLEVYPEENKGIQKIDLEFYDNQGHTATLTLKDKNSYSGTFTETIALNSASNTNLQPSNKHKGSAFKKPSKNWNEEDNKNLDDLVKSGIYIEGVDEEGGLVYYENDSGIIYPNLLYLVKIRIYYLNKDTSGNFIEGTPKEFYRWYWTNSMFNQYYYDYYDFNTLNMDVNINVQGQFKEIDSKFKIKNEPEIHNSYNDSIKEDQQFYSLGYNLHKIESQDANINMKLIPFVENSYNTFALDRRKLEDLTYSIIEGTSNIEVSSENIISSENSTVIAHSEVVKQYLSDTENGSYITNVPESYPSSNFEKWIKSLKDWFTLEIRNSSNDSKYANEEYIDIKNTLKKIPSSYKYISKNGIQALESGIDLILNGMMFSKITTNDFDLSYSVSAIRYKPLISKIQDLSQYNICIYNINNTPYFMFKTLIDIAMGDSYGHVAGAFYVQDETGLQRDEEFSVDGDGKTKYFNTPDVIYDKAKPVGTFTTLIRHWYREGANSKDKYKNQVTILGDTNNNAAYISRTWKSQWGGNCNDGKIQNDNADSIAFSDAYNSYLQGNSNNTLSTGQFLMLNSDNKYVAFNAFYRHNAIKQTSINNHYFITQRFKSPVDKFYSMAEIMVSMLSSIYYSDNTTISETIPILKDIIYKDTCSEIWKKDFIIKMNIPDLRSLLTISKISFNDYINGFKSNNNLEYDKITLTNIEVQNANLSKTSNLIQFQYNIDYNVKDLIRLYNKYVSTVILAEQNILGTAQQYQDNVSGNILFLNEKGILQSSYSDIMLHPIDITDNVTGQKSFKYKDSIGLPLGNIYKYCTVIDGRLYAKTNSYPSTKWAAMPSGDGWNEIQALGFNAGLTISSKFAV